MKRLLSLVCLSVIGLVTLASSPRAHADPKKSVAVLGLELKDDGTGIDERSANIARVLTEALRNRAKAPSGPYTLAPGGDKELVDALLLAGCAKAEDNDCMAKIGNEITADYLIYGSLVKSGKGFQVSLTLLDDGHKSVVRRLTDTIPGSDTGDVKLAVWGKNLYARLTGASSQGNVLVTANVDSGQVFVDGQPKGNLVKGQARINGLDEGKAKIRIESGGSIKEQIVTISGGETTNVDVKLDVKGGDGSTGAGPGLTGTNGLGNNISIEGTNSEGRPGGGWRKAAIASGIVALAAGGVWVYSYTQISKHEDAICHNKEPCDAVDQHTGFNTSDDYIRHHNSEGDKFSTITFVAGPVTVIAGGLCVYSVIRGFISPGKRQPHETPGTVTLHKKGSTKVTLTPIVTPEGGAASFRIDW